jgi:hypothetical protein
MRRNIVLAIATVLLVATAANAALTRRTVTGSRTSKVGSRLDTDTYWREWSRQGTSAPWRVGAVGLSALGSDELPT